MEGSRVSILWNREQILKRLFFLFLFLWNVFVLKPALVSENKEQPRNSRIEMQVAERYLLIIIVTCICAYMIIIFTVPMIFPKK